MKNFDKRILIKNLTGILCGAMILCFLLPFFSAEANAKVMGASSSSTNVVNGIQVLTEGGFMGIMLIICPILILLINYIPQLGQYKKIVSLILSVLSILIMFIVPGQISAQANGGGSSIDVKTTYQIGFWLMLIFAIGIAALSAIQFFNLKGNKVFDTVNTADNSTEISNSFTPPQVNLDKITDFAKNTANNASQKIKNVAGNLSNNVANSNIQNPTANSVDDFEIKEAKPYNLPLSKKSAPTIQKENPEEIMNLIKKLYEMKESGILTDEEFATKKQEMLEKM